ncbi:MAG: hypothetical protein ACOCYW_04870 [Roseicyclus sp.]
MDRLFEPIDIYCERLGPGLWAEPVNAATNLAFLIAAWVVAGRLGPDAPPLARALCLILAAIGLGSGLWHIFANPLTAMIDVAAIAAFVFTYVFAVNRHVLGWPPLGAWFGLLALVAWLGLGGMVFGALPGFAISAGYWPIALLIALYGVVLLRSRPAFARGLLIGAAILTVSLGFRSVDMALCATFPLGTHFVWHILNAVMLGWMIEVYASAGRRGPEPLAVPPERR